MGDRYPDSDPLEGKIQHTHEYTETDPLLGSKSKSQRGSVANFETGIYLRRWWILLIFSGCCCQQGIVWNTWGPITQSAKTVFGWSDGAIGMLANFGNIAYTILVLPACYLMDVKGLRIAMIACTSLLTLATGIRCITHHNPYATWLMNIGAILNGAAGTIPFAGPALIASKWFPPNQRATATAISSFFNYAGVALSFIIGPHIVSSPKYVHGFNDSIIVNNSNATVIVNLDQVTTEIMRLMYIHCSITVVLFIAVLLYFPQKPPKPPSITASIERISYTKALSKVVKHGPLWLITIAAGLPCGVYGVWGSVIDIILNPVNVGQTEVGWIGFYSTMAGCAAGLVIARFSDIFMRHMKLFVITLFILYLYCSCILGGMFLNGSIPLFYELACETSYPVAEGITGGFLTLFNNLFGIIFLLVLLIPGIGTIWMNYCLLGSIGLGLVFMCLFPESYSRTDIDITIDIPAPEPETDIQFHIHDSAELNHQTKKI
ncbi:hypothetical protein KUTeg_005760 [Tegillarca granosa]|uniref:Uncharacterized protein n=1 Tax=Tegillarca granosa TaxID=220873 RepID=A0ABQ9FHC3_TEGGR|nr:hypothetical protein KUTeg_005760 [Tegillarca granosa]